MCVDHIREVKATIVVALIDNVVNIVGLAVLLYAAGLGIE